MSTGGRVEVVLDTNVLVSAALSDGPPALLLEVAADGDITSVTSPAILAELHDVLTRDRLPFTETQVDGLVTTVLANSRLVTPRLELTVVEDDPDDDKIVEAAVSAGVDYIVSGDSHLQDLGAYGAIEIYAPAEFVDEFDID